MSEIKEYAKGFPYSNRFIDGIDIQADGPIKDAILIKYFDEEKNIQDISFNDFRYAVYSVAHKYSENIKDHWDMKQDQTFVPIGYLSPTDKDCIINHSALMYLNFTPVLLSPRNSLDTMIHLLRESCTKVLVYSELFKDVANKCQDVIPELLLIPKFIFSRELVEPSPAPIPLIKNQGNEHIINIMHTSGTTALPRLIHMSERYYMKNIERCLGYPDVSPLMVGNMLTLAPLFHIYGTSTFWRIFHKQATAVFASLNSNFSSQTLIDECKISNSNSMILLPFHIKQLVGYCDGNHQLNTWESLDRVNSIQFAGAPLSHSIVKQLLERNIYLINTYGSTEVGMIGTYVYKSAEDNPRALKLNQGMDYELVERNGDTAQIKILSSELSLATGVCIPEEDGYLSGDVIKIIKHDKEADILEFEVLGRKDDIIVHVSGEKTNPTHMEEIIESCTLIEKCAIVGTGRLNNCVLVQLNRDEAMVTSLQKLLKIVYYQIDLANKEAPSHSRIDHDLVYLLPLDTKKPFPITAKGNLNRSKVEEHFHDEIENLYSSFESSGSPRKLQLSTDDDFSQSRISQFIENLFREVVEKNIKAGTSLFNQGMDSLNAVKFSNIIKATYPKANISVNVIYEMDTLELLTNYIFSKYKGEEVQTRSLDSYQSEVDSLIQEYTNYPRKDYMDNIQTSKETKLNVLVSGANGSLGSFLVKSLLGRDAIGNIYGMVRAADNIEALEKIKSSFSDRKIVLSESQWARVKGFAYKNNDVKLGLSQDDYDLIFNSVDIIYHVAWRMDFLKGVQHFRDCIESTVNLLRISALSPIQPAFHFTSTIGAAFPVNTSMVIAESKLKPHLANIDACNGYNLSKLVSEIICLRWSEEFGFPLDIHRVGQVSGDTKNGVWNVREHISLLIKAAQVMEMIPESFVGSVSWIPVDIASDAMVEINFDKDNIHKGTVNHIGNPQMTSWKKIILFLQELGIPCKPVSSKKFIETLRSEPKYQDVELNPLASLTDFSTKVFKFESTIDVNLDVSLTSLRSPSIKSCDSVNLELMSKYINYWISIGFLLNPSP